MDEILSDDEVDQESYSHVANEIRAFKDQVADPNSVYGKATPEERAALDRKHAAYVKEHNERLAILESEGEQE